MSQSSLAQSEPAAESSLQVLTQQDVGVRGASGWVRRLAWALASVPPLNRGHARPILARWIIRLSGGVVRVSFRGGTFEVGRNDHPGEYGMMLYPAYNRAEFEFLLGGLTEGGVAVDLGANIGMFSIPLAIGAGATGRVIAIDASARFLKRLMRNATLSRLGNIDVQHVAVGDKEGTARLLSVENNPGTAEVCDDETGEVPMRPLLAILRGRGVDRVDVLKVDIDGFEDRALTPFFQDAPTELLPARVVLEHVCLEPKRGGCLAAMRDRGYECVGRTLSNSLHQLGW